MPDIFTKKKRSWIMSKIRSNNTSIDNSMDELLTRMGIKFKKYPKMFGNPDFIIPSKKIVIFCDGDFWHGYNYLKKGKKLPNEYWKNKINKNIQRDRCITSTLKSDGWIVLRFWEHQIIKNLTTCEKKIRTTMGKPIG